MTKVCLFLVYFAGVYSYKQARISKENDYVSDSPAYHHSKNRLDSEYQNDRQLSFVRQRSGTDMNLKCNLRSCDKDNVIWEFKTCQSDYKMEPCSNFYEENEDTFVGNVTWEKLDVSYIRRKCAVNLLLEDITESKSGLYRCSEDSKILRIYQVEIIESANKYIGQPPELLTIVPSNITIHQNMQFIIQCKVYSKQPPVIWWFKQSDGSSYDIQYSEKYYNRINTTFQIYPVPHEVNVYLSKLNVYHAQDIDSGVYVCLAMTESGKDYKDAVVKVITTNPIWEPHTSFFLLFLIPVIFALIPITVWLWYYRKKNKSTHEMRFTNFHEGHLVSPILCDSAAIHNNHTAI